MTIYSADRLNRSFVMESQRVDRSACTPPFTSQSSSTSGTHSDLPRPRYFVARKDGTITPLIAVDELPDTLRIVGIPAIMSPAATLNMVSLGVLDRSQHRYVVEISDLSLSSTLGKHSPLLLAHGSNSSIPDKLLVAPNGGAHKGMAGSAAKGVEQWRQDVKSIDETQAAIDAVIDANEQATAGPVVVHADAGTPGTFGKKVYCTHWIRWGECDYTQQGCLYKHEMPDEPTLNSIGIRTIPKWYRDVNAPKNGWVGRPAPADQLWRGKNTRPAQPHQPLKPFPAPAQPPKPFVLPARPVPAPRPTIIVPSTGIAPPNYQQPAPPGPKVFGRASSTPEQRYAPSGFPVAHSQPISAPQTLHNAPQPVQVFPVPNISPFTSPQVASRSNPNFHNLPPNYHPLTPSFNPTPAAALKPVPASAPKSTPSPSFIEPQTPMPVHRRLFVPAGEASFVINPIPAGEGVAKTKEATMAVAKAKEATKAVAVSGSGTAKGNGEFLLDLE